MMKIGELHELAVRAKKTRDPRALEQLVNESREHAMRYLTSHFPKLPRDDAEDIAADKSQLALTGLLDKWRADSKYSTMFLRMVHNKAVDYFRNKRSTETPLHENIAHDVELESKLQNEAVAKRFNKILPSLPAIDRDILRLRHYDAEGNLREEIPTITEMGEMLGITRVAANLRLIRAYKKVRERMELDTE